MHSLAPKTPTEQIFRHQSALKIESQHYFQNLGAKSPLAAFTRATFLIKVTLLRKITVSSCFHSDSDILNLFKSKIGADLTAIVYRSTDSFLKFSIITILV